MKTICASCGSSDRGCPVTLGGQPGAGRCLRPAVAGGQSPRQYDAIADFYDGYPGNYLDDVLFYAEEAKAARTPVLEIGVGTGRLALCLAAVGVDVVGIDSSLPMLARLARKRAELPELRGRVRVIAADMRDFCLRQRFELVFAPFRAFCYLLTRDDQRRALRAMWRHIEPGGRLIMSFFVPPADLLALGRTPRQEASRFTAPGGDGEVVAFDWTEFRPSRQHFISHLSYEWRGPDQRVVRRLEHTMTGRYTFPEEVPPLLESCRYRVLSVYGSFARAPLQERSREQIWVAQPA